MIQNIKITRLHPHPNNPRQDLGDLTELAESIRTRGVMQNLTVIPENEKSNFESREGYYVVVIGHRRLAAAKLAGLAELPCAVVEMTEQEQVATMLLENIQRADLTVLEQAKGFQMLIDFGETYKSISQKTGFSETTVRKRLFVASLNAEKSKTAYARGASLEDYMKLQQLTNTENRDKVLEALGTNNFDYVLRKAISEELCERVSPKIIEQIKEFASPTDRTSWELKGYGYYSRCAYEEYEKTRKLDIKVPKKWKPDEYLYYVSTMAIEIYKQRESFNATQKMSELSPEEQEKRREKRRKYKELKKCGEAAYQLRLDFVKAFSQRSALNMAQSEALSEFAFAALCLGDNLDYVNYASLEGLETENTWRFDYPQKKEMMKTINSPAARLLLVSLYSTFRDSDENTYFCGTEASAEKRGRHKTNEKLDAIYGCLCALGYEMSDEEQQLRNGTHELFS